MEWYQVLLREKDSNLRPPGYEPGKLTSALSHNLKNWAPMRIDYLIRHG